MCFPMRQYFCYFSFIIINCYRSKGVVFTRDNLKTKNMQIWIIYLRYYHKLGIFIEKNE